MNRLLHNTRKGGPREMKRWAVISSFPVLLQACTFEQNTDFNGNDLPGSSDRFNNVPNASNCCGICKAYSGCKAWTWIPPSHCFVKESDAGRRSWNGYVSGSLAGPAPPPVTPIQMPTPMPTPTPPIPPGPCTSDMGCSLNGLCDISGKCVCDSPTCVCDRRGCTSGKTSPMQDAHIAEGDA